MDSLRAAGFFGHEHSQVSGFTNQLSNERQISSVVAGIINIIPFTSAASSSSAGVNGQTISFTQSLFTAHVDVVKSGFISAAISNIPWFH